MKKIPLTQGQFALVDDDRFDELSQWKWSATWAPDVRSFYASRSLQRGGIRTTERMHRRVTNFAWDVVDHINHDTLDNRIENLRDGTGTNARNMRPREGGATSRFHGVSWATRDQRWVAYISLRGKSIRLGAFVDEVEAALAYDRASRELHGEYGTRNFEEGTP